MNTDHLRDASVNLDFLVIGAQKSGTTAMHFWLAQESGLSLPTPKESHFFSDDAVHRQGPEWYSARFSTAAGDLVGEVDPSNMASLVAAQRVRTLAGDIPIVALVREPLRRAYSQYGHNTFRGRDSRTFATALRQEVDSFDGSVEDLELKVRSLERHGSDQLGTYLWRGLYARHIRRWRSEFSNVAVFFFEDLVTPGEVGAASYAELLAHIGYKGPGRGWDPARRENSTGVARSGPLAHLMYDPKRLAGTKRLLKRAIPDAKARRRLRDRMNSSDRNPEKMPHASELPLPARQLLASDVQDLSTLTGKNLDHWLANLAL